ncbi:MAG: TIGR01212 family radical SAM protein [Thermodesulfobacteriota bacterium]|nr:TIGR01212 family radical SAM protein [Thermodesulfobacteriota bacterium]
MKRYRDFNGYLKEIFGERVQKIPLDAGLNCPNRDGSISDKGCVFCDPRGSGTGSFIDHGLSIDQQIAKARRFIQKRYGAKKFIAYFQSFTNTYAPIPRLKALYDQALAYDDMVGLSVSTRPDCIDPDVLKLLCSYKKDHLVWVEYGLQSAHDLTLDRINRGHDVDCFERSVVMASESGLNVCAHIILGLPGEDRAMMLQTARLLSDLPVHGVKIHLLYVVEGTHLAAWYKQGEFRCLQREEYVDLVVGFLELLSPATVIQRLTGDPLKSELVAPLWANEKTTNLRLIRERLEREKTWQGRMYRKSTAGKYQRGI